VYEQFRRCYDSGRPALPQVIYPAAPDSGRMAALEGIMRRCDRGHPVANFLYLTAQSYLLAERMLESIGTPAFTEYSSLLYGKPRDPLADGMTHLHASDFFVEATHEFVDAAQIPPQACHFDAEYVAGALEAELQPFFDRHNIRVVVDPAMASKATAGAQRIRIRGATRFSQVDIAQLANHEGYVHMLTALNGREQPNLHSMGLSSPRTTWTQEGLATFSEFITASIDLNRMRRIALRTKAVQMGLDGADFMEVYRFFLDAGQDEYESFQSAARIFRGGDTRGGVIFTKDVVYLQGLIRTHTFLRKAVQSNKFQYAEHLFAGRMTLGDVIALEPFFESGFIAPPYYEPPWLQNRSNFAAYLCYSVFANQIKLSAVSLEDFLAMETTEVAGLPGAPAG
jgi:uncharacterized protein (TIGR02421 family)